jgi:tetratricopeptide (TPR) repeat protein
VTGNGTAVVGFVLAQALLTAVLPAQPTRIDGWPQHSRARPAPPVVTPGGFAATPRPSDAIVLLDGTGVSRWRMSDGTPAKWKLTDGVLEVTPGTGTLESLDSIGDAQLHIEWMSPNPPRGRDQDRGNSGVFFGGGRYEVQVLDSYKSETYVDGQAGSVYGQYPPLVNASRPPGEWQSYDIVFRRPRFSASGAVLQKASLTVFHNGVLVQDHQELVGPTSNSRRIPYAAHPDRMPITLQDHGHTVRFRNAWMRSLEPHPQATVQYVSPEGETYRANVDGGNVAKARAALGDNYRDTEKVIALGVAHAGAWQFREAITTFTRGLAALPKTPASRKDEATLLRWRGHRYISVREFAKADADLTRGLALDSTNYGILFHLGVLRFLQGRFNEAAGMFARAQPHAPDGGERAGSTDWLWMSLSRAGKSAEAAAMLARRIDTLPDPRPAPPGYGYVSRLKLYRGEVTPEQLFTPADSDAVQVATLNYGLGNWYFVRGDTARAKSAWERAVHTGGWPGFGFNVAEAELRRLAAAAPRKPASR